MMLVTAIVKPHALQDVRAGLDRLDVAGMTVSEAAGPAGRVRTLVHRGAVDEIHLAQKVRVEVVVEASVVEKVVDAVGSGAGDGTIWVVPVDTVVRVRTGERGADAL